MIRPSWRAALLVLCAGLQGCAGAETPPSDGRPRRPLPNVFISLAGQPFRAPAGAPYPVATWFGEADTNHDGRLSLDETLADADRFFSQLDLDHDGVIDGAELQAYEQSVAPEILPQIVGLHAMEGQDQGLSFGDPNNSDTPPATPGRGGGGGGGQPGVATGVGTQGAAVFSLVNTPEPVAAADSRFDGRVDRREFDAAVAARFHSLDKTGAGYLTLAGLPKTPIQKEIEARAKAERKTAKGPAPA